MPRAVACPTWVLRERNRPSLLPGLVPPNPAPTLAVPFITILDKLRNLRGTGACAFAALDWLHATTGLLWKDCADVFRSMGWPVDNGAVEMTRTARLFWNHFHEFRQLWANAVARQQIEEAEGLWGLVESQEVLHWLPGIRIPKMQRRSEYFVRISPRGGSLIHLDFHASSYRPLFRVPL
jgi:hypothetical protein